MKGFLAGVAVAVIVIVGAVFLFFASGLAPVATSAAPMPFEQKLAEMALDARIEREMPKTAPIPADEPNLMAGARVYVNHCAICHSLPGQPGTAIAKGMFPQPPSLFDGMGVIDDPPGETYWKAANGIRLTGMPAFKGQLSETELWQVSLLLANAARISPAVKAALTQPTNAAPTAGK